VPQDRILITVIGRPHGVRGLVRVQCYAENPADLRRYGVLTDERGRAYRLRWQSDGIAEISEIVDGKPVKVADRSAAERLVNRKLFVARERLPAPDDDEFYLADLVGLAAVTPDGREVGRIAAVHDHGAGTYLDVAGLLVPFTRAAVPTVDLEAGRVVVLPPAEIVGDKADEAAA
jgi:16S rRNA processing protein RimM